MRLSLKILVVVSILFFGVRPVGAQESHDFFADTKVKNDSSKFILQIHNTNFLKNNEYFNQFVGGYTLIGYFLQPKVRFHAHDKLNLYAGLHLQKYSGIDAFTQVFPTFTIEYLPTNNLTIRFGTIQNTINHNLSDFVYNNEYYLTDNNENGLQITYSKSRFSTDTWIDWKQYIFKGSEYPEFLFFGTTNIINLYSKNEKPFLDLKLCAVASHVGGQIDNSGVSVETIANSTSGIDIHLYPKSKLITQIDIFGHYHTSIDNSPEKRLKYLYGYGILSGIGMSNQFLDIKLQHWYGEYYFSKFGNPMYSSISSTHTNHNEDQRAFAIANLFYQNNKVKNLKIGLGVNFYYDLYNLQLDYSFGFYLKTNLNFILDKNK